MKLIVLENNSYTIEIERSKFIASIFHVKDIEDVKNALQNVKKANYKANHNCYAYIIDDSNYKCSDDGEPSSSAGAPILDVIKGNNLKETLIVVTRYFGGIKLGVGGLIKAYQSAAIGVINKSKIYEVNSLPHYGFKIPYSLNDIVDYFIRSNNIKVVNKIYDIEISYEIYVDNQDIISKLNDTLQGKVEIKYLYNKDIIKEK